MTRHMRVTGNVAPEPSSGCRSLGGDRWKGCSAWSLSVRSGALYGRDRLVEPRPQGFEAAAVDDRRRIERPLPDIVPGELAIEPTQA